MELLETISATQLKAVDFATFHIADALEVIEADIMEEIRKANRGCSAEKLVFYFSENFPQNFTHCSATRFLRNADKINKKNRPRSKK